MKWNTTLWDPTDYIKTNEDIVNAILAEFEQPDTNEQTRAQCIEILYKAYKRWGWK